MGKAELIMQNYLIKQKRDFRSKTNVVCTNFRPHSQTICDNVKDGMYEPGTS